MGQALVRLVDVSKAYGSVSALREASLDVMEGEFFTLLGPSGSGKSTTLMLIAGFEQPSAGQILFRGVSLGARPPHKREMGMVFQNYALFPHMTVFENVAFPLRMHRVRRSEMAPRVRDMLAVVGLPGLEGRYPRQLSGGQQQRVALARALVYRPALLLLDEPLGALDKKLREEMQSELKSIQRELGVTTLYVTHDQQEALALSDRIAIMNRGEIVQVGSPLELYERPASAFVAGFLGDVNLLEGCVTGREGRDLRIAVEGGLLVRAEGDSAIALGARVIVAIRPERLTIGDEASGAYNAWPGVVSNTVFVGELVRHSVALSGGVRMKLTRQYQGAESVWAEGRSVVLSVTPRDCRVVSGVEQSTSEDRAG
jgi:spermidine/putrescine ABC transporter ATP-binding subunit